MKKREPVSHIMTENVLTVNKTNSLIEAENIMRENHIRHVPVVSGDELIGMLSLTDLKRISFADNFGNGEGAVDSAIYSMLTIEQIMKRNVKSIEASTTIKEVAEVFSKEEYHALPVVSQGKLMGIVTTTDVIKYLLEQY
jgi:CBS domain-containing membrane protein